MLGGGERVQAPPRTQQGMGGESSPGTEEGVSRGVEGVSRTEEGVGGGVEGVSGTEERVGRVGQLEVVIVGGCQRRGDSVGEGGEDNGGNDV